jgi:hypothetical protein
MTVPLQENASVKPLRSAGLSCVALLAAAVSARALMIAPPAIPQRVAAADAVLVGKVLKIEDKAVNLPRFPGDTEKAAHLVAVVRVDDAILGVKGKEVRVAYLPQQPGQVGRPPIRRYPTVDLKVDQEACLMLRREGDLYVAPAYYDVLSKEGNPGFAKEVELVRKSAKLLTDPKAGLEAKEAQDRFLTAAMLVTRYRTQKPGAQQPKQEQIDAAESKLILKALAEADWMKADPQLFRMTPQAVFYQLGLTPADGWQPQPNANVVEQAKKWLKDNAETYRIKKFVNP